MSLGGQRKQRPGRKGSTEANEGTRGEELREQRDKACFTLCFFALGDLHGCNGRSAGGYPDHEALLCRHPASHGDSVVTGDLDDLVNYGGVAVARDEASPDSLDLVRARVSARKDRALRGLDCNYLDVGVFLLWDRQAQSTRIVREGRAVPGDSMHKTEMRDVTAGLGSNVGAENEWNVVKDSGMQGIQNQDGGNKGREEVEKVKCLKAPQKVPELDQGQKGEGRGGRADVNP